MVAKKVEQGSFGELDRGIFCSIGGFALTRHILFRVQLWQQNTKHERGGAYNESMNYELWAEHITTPYLPMVGLVHPDCVRPQTLQAVVQSLRTGIRPEFDKSIRWGSENLERLANTWYMQTDGVTIILTTRGDITTAYIYTPYEKQLKALVQQARKDGAAKVCTFAHIGDTAKVHVSHAFLGEAKKQTKTSPHVRQISRDEQELAELCALDNGKEMAGLDFLASQIAKRDDLGSTLGYFVGGKLLGMIGPLDVRCDAIGHKYLLPPYFGVHQGVRGKGAGRELWDAAMNYAADLGAEYVLVQAEDGAESVGFYQKTEMRLVGRINLLRS